MGVINRDTALYDNTKSGISRVWNPFYPQGSDGGWFDTQYGSEEPPFVAQIGEISSFTRGLKAYEISNHLGNVLATVSDKKFGYGTTVADGVLQMDPTSDASYFQPEILSAQDYYAYGATKPGRRGSLKKNAEGNIAFVFDEAADINNWRPLFNYRFGYNTQEQTPEVTGGQHNTAEFWEYNPSGIIRWNLDPVTTPNMSPYAINKNNPIIFSDPNGDVAGDYYNQSGKHLGSDGKDDGRHYVVTDESKAGTLSEKLVAAGAAFELPPIVGRRRMHQGYAQTLAGGNKFESGGGWGKFYHPDKFTEILPETEAWLAEPGQPTADNKQLEMNIKNFDRSSDIAILEGRFHTHPGGVFCKSCPVGEQFLDKIPPLKPGEYSNETKQYESWGKYPSLPDLENAKNLADPTKHGKNAFLGWSYVIQVGREYRQGMLYIYRGDTEIYDKNGKIDWESKHKNFYKFPLFKDADGNHGLFELHIQKKD